MTFRFELGYLWGFTEHFFVGIAFKTVLSFNNEEGDEYRGKICLLTMSRSTPSRSVL